MAKKSFYTSPIKSLKTESNRDHAGPEKILITVQGSILDAIMVSSRPRNDPFSANYYFHHIGHRRPLCLHIPQRSCTVPRPQRPARRRSLTL